MLADCQNFWHYADMNSAQIIRALGGATRVSKELGAKRSAVSNWLHGIPARYWPAVARLAAAQPETAHITIEAIEAAHVREAGTAR